MVEREDEGQQIQGERQHPQERHAGNVLRHVVAHREQHHGGKRRKGQPGQLHGARERRGRVLRLSRSRGRLRDDRAHGAPRRGAAQHDESRVQRRPPPAQLGQREIGLQQHRESQQREQRRKVGERKKAVGHCAPEALPVPGLQQRRRGRQQKVRQADGGPEQQQDAAHGLLVALRLPARRCEDRQARERRGEQRYVQHRLPPQAQARGQVGVGIPAEQHRLEEHEACRPHRRRPTEPRQDLLGDDRLHQEQQERGQEDRRRIGQDREAADGGRHRVCRRDGRSAFRSAFHYRPNAFSNTAGDTMGIRECAASTNKSSSPVTKASTFAA